MRVSKLLPTMSLALLLGACGQAPETSQVKVTNGMEISEDEFPAVVLLLDSEKGAICTGTFIDDATVITAAHCTMGGEVVNKKTGEVDHTISLVRMIDTEKKQVEKIADSVEIFRNPVWDDEFKKQQVNKFDLGIIRFPAGTAPAVRSIAKSRAQVGDQFTIVGYGLNYVPKNQNDVDPSSAGIKRKGNNKISQYYQGFLYFSGQTSTTNGNGTNANASSGDSGGPMFVDGELVGVTSGGGRDLFGRGVSLYIDLHTPESKDFLNSVGIFY